MKRFFQMVLVLAGTVAGIIVLMWIFYAIAYAFAWAFSGSSWSPVGRRPGVQLAAGTVDGRLAGFREPVPQEPGEDGRSTQAQLP